VGAIENYETKSPGKKVAVYENTGKGRLVWLGHPFFL